MSEQKKLEYKKRTKKIEANVDEEGGRISYGNPMAPKEDKDKEDLFETRRMLDILMEAEEIKSDAAKMERVRKLAGRKMAAIKSIQDLKDIYAAKTEAGHFNKKKE